MGLSSHLFPRRDFRSKRFSTPPSRCVRLHYFSRAVTYEELKTSDRVQNDYLGYSVIRPTRPNCVGRTLIDIKNYTGLGAYICTCKEKVTLQGTELTVEGFPFISQDSDATVCAESALWMTVRYFSNRYSLYSETYPFQDSRYYFRDIDSFIAPLAEKIFLSAENFEKVVLQVLDNSKTGIQALSPELSYSPRLVLRMYLTTVRSYKKKLSERGMGNPKVENLYRQLPLPHFIWICELSTPDEYSHGKVLGEIVWDATRNVWETEGWIAIHYPEILLIDMGSALNEQQEFYTFSLTGAKKAYPMHRSNLKGV